MTGGFLPCTEFSGDVTSFLLENIYLPLMITTPMHCSHTTPPPPNTRLLAANQR